jgi:hypothetical protein
MIACYDNENAFALETPHLLSSMPSSNPHRPTPFLPRSSLLMWGAGQRLAAAGLLLLGLWLAVAWALGD